ncbi:MAG TPA: VWA domain-containing protein [Thermoanaerobaculia bacterium]|nr:VWA domain-containing protein [Thermoanaerobaculia bacterium]
MPRSLHSISFALVSGVGVFWIAAANASLQPNAPTQPVVQERAGVTVIEVPVNVIGKDGKPVTGLTAGDFELYDDGKKQPISAVDVLDLSRPIVAGQGAALPLPAAARRLWLIVFDLSYTSPGGLLRARTGIRSFVTDAMGPNDLAAVGTLSVDKGWRLLVNFTHDRRQLAAAVDTLGLTTGFQHTSDPLAFAYRVPESWLSPAEAASALSGRTDRALLDNIRDQQRMQRQANDEYARGRVGNLINSLAGIGRTLDAVRGRKHLLFLSEGFDTRLMSGQGAGSDPRNSLSQTADASRDALTPQGAADAAMAGEYWKIDNEAHFGSSSTSQRMTDALALFNRSDVVLDAIDVSGLRSEGDFEPRTGSGSDSLATLASETHGDLIRNANQLGGEIERIAQRTALVYLLAYQPRGLNKPGTLHELKVKVRLSGVKVLSRSGYYEPRPYQNLTPLERVLASGDLVMGGAPQNEVQANLLAVPFASSADLPQVPVVLEVPGGPLLAGDTGAQTAVQIYGYANDASGSLADYFASGMTLDLAKLRPSLESGGIKFYGTMYLPPGEYDVRVLVRNGTTGRSGVSSTRFRVPAMPGDVATVLPPLFQEAPGRWVMVRGNPRTDAPQRPADYPFAVAGETFVPTATPVVSSGQKTRVAIVAYNFAVGEKPAPLGIRGEIVNAEGGHQPANLTVERRSDFERGGGRKLLLTLDPQGLSPGRYVLKVTVTDPSGKKGAESSSDFEVK